MKKLYYIYLVLAVLVLFSLINKIAQGSSEYMIFNFKTNEYVYLVWKLFLVGGLFFLFYTKRKPDSKN
ncbi:MULTISPECIES: hypothetical protein [Flavobacterium]|uniref:Uncharacterized protein n=2 Tax=Flavobacterium TaxID=237 RepID=A0A0X8C274_9FLAO|nr:MULTISPECIES: hypothetical protein [Flavobacterium]AMA49725.1 hypothetical protein AWN65_09770 [Flavobacterium covae]MCJ1809561.1 hypothetical protein [Flavobacterium covae]OWP75832.1 hypothetical protein BWG23_09740 [Flavobacterium oreochromis]OWP76373.1 hypothetical protein BWK62_09800 [Flavobacterium oreochromis]